MSCRKIESLFETGDVSADASAAERSELQEHAAKCAPCRQFLNGQNELEVGLALLRSSVPETPAGLDLAVIGGFRRQAALRDAQAVHRFQIRLRPRILRWSLASAAVVLLVFAAILLRPKQASIQTEVSSPAPHIASAPPTQPQNAVALKKKMRAMPRALAGGSHDTAVYDNSVADGFRSLMFCDAISCDGNMEVVRIQLPSSVMPLSAAAQPRATSADVLIGEDGVARAIRIVE